MNKVFAFLLFVFVSQNALAEFTCDTNVYDYYATFIPTEYTCQSGYYLPANTDGCVACPNGFVCNGGTFSFNLNESQGLYINSTFPNTTLTNMCADNFPIDLYAVYQVNTMTLNFDDGNGNVTSTTCEYGDTITIPDTVPTRTGYNFAGWVVRQNDD